MAVSAVRVSVCVCAVTIVVSAVLCDSDVTEKYGGSLRLVNVKTQSWRRLVYGTKNQLRFVTPHHEVFRHGQRTPADTYPSDPYLQFDFHPYGWGQLTNKGKQQQYELGQYLRQRYDQFLGDGYWPSVVRVQSTDVDRTIMSAQLAMAGLFPPAGNQRWNERLDWQPVPVHSQPLDQDSLLLVRVPCPRYHEAREEVKSHPDVRQYHGDLKLLYDSLSRHSGMTISDPDDVQSLYSTLLAETQFNLTLPTWTSAYFPEPMAAVTAHSFTLNAYTDEMKKLKGGPLLKKILEDAEERVNDKLSRKKVFAYAGHDSTVANLLSALGVWEEQIPIYNIMVLLELHQEGDDYGFKIFLRNSTEQEPYPLRVPGCEVFCPLGRLTELTRHVLPSDLDTECVSHQPGYIAPDPARP